ncbi:MAG: hypothetical protein FJ280_20030, partial [Planctomycetes bacterium]|nr:hypothetical protein [Planctomycetota bacterium]
MSLRAKRGDLPITDVNYPPELAYLATDTPCRVGCAHRSEQIVVCTAHPTDYAYEGLEFYIDGQWRDEITGDRDWEAASFPVTGEQMTWAQKTFTVSGAGPHTLRWCYTKSGTGGSGSDYDAAWVDCVQWTGAMPPEPAPTAWATLNYVYDAFGRRIEKKYDGRTILQYVYDGDHCIAEYDAAGNLKRKYLYGPGIDEPICMIESSGTYAGTYYYHFDALGSVVALTNSSGNTVQVYEYDVYGRVGATDASHPNRIL